MDDYRTFSKYLSYDEKSGDLTWVKRPSNRVNVGDKISTRHNEGYLKLGFLGKEYLAHRVAWLLYYGEWPKDFIDHKDGDRANNRINNLRSASSSQNNRNKSGCGKSTYLGVGWDNSRHKWISSIYHKGRNKYLGRFDSEVDAALRYNEFAKLYWGDWAKLNKAVRNET